MKLSTWAKQQGVCYMTAYRWFNAGLLPVKAYQTPTGCILVQEEQNVNKEIKETSIYCRVSSHNKKEDLERQAQRCIDFCNANGWTIKQVIKEIASGMNDKRPKLTKLINDKPQRIVVEHKDRLTRFGFNYFDLLLPKLNCELIVINKDQEESSDLMKDLVSVVTSFCCRLYGLRKGKNKVNKIKECIKEQ